MLDSSMEISLDLSSLPLPPFVACSSVNTSGINDETIFQAFGSFTAAAANVSLGASTVTSESSSEAVVSLFNCWNEESLSMCDVPVFVGIDHDSSFHVPGDVLLLPQGEKSSQDSPPKTMTTTTTPLPLEALSLQDLLQCLKKRLRPEDIPSVPVLKRRKRPTCSFLNYMGKTRVQDYQQRHGVKLHVGSPEIPEPSPDAASAVASVSLDSSVNVDVDDGSDDISRIAYSDMCGIEWAMKEFEDNDDWFLSMPLAHFSTKSKFADRTTATLMSMDEDFEQSHDEQHQLHADVAAVLELELGDSPPVMLIGTL